MNEKKNNKTTFIITGLVLFILIITALLLLFKKDENNNNILINNTNSSNNNEPIWNTMTEPYKMDEDLELNELVRNMLSKAFDINQIVLDKSKISSDVEYHNTLGINCYRYLGEDSSELIKKYKEIYSFSNDKVEPIVNLSSFYNDENKEELFICLSNQCEFANIEKDNFEVISLNENKKLVMIDSFPFELEKINNKWIFTEQVYRCNESYDD